MSKMRNMRNKKNMTKRILFNCVLLAIILGTAVIYNLSCNTESQTQNETENQNTTSLRSSISKELDSLMLASTSLSTSNSTSTVTAGVSKSFKEYMLDATVDIKKIDVQPVQAASVEVTAEDESDSSESELSMQEIQEIQTNNFKERSFEPEYQNESETETNIADTTLIYNTLVYPLAKIMYAEGGDQSDNFQQYVGYVVLNRVDSKYYPNSIYDVFFSGDAYHELSRERYRNEMVSDQCIKNAKIVVNQYLTGTIPVSPAMVFQAEFKQGVNMIKIYNTYFGHDQRIIDDLSDPEINTP